jgi:hypothetical protein
MRMTCTQAPRIEYSKIYNLSSQIQVAQKAQDDQYRLVNQSTFASHQAGTFGSHWPGLSSVTERFFQSPNSYASH